MIVAPSILAINYLNITQQLEILNQSNAKWLHYDIMDGHFVPNMTFGPDFVNAVSNISKLTKDVHLMVENPVKIAEYFLSCKPDYLTCHFESTNNLQEFVDLCRINDINPGISLKPNTPPQVLEDVVDLFDLVLIMSVEPGFGNQKFQLEALEKISYFAKRKHNYLIEVDGGINQETGNMCKAAGADILVAGSYIFKADICQQVDSLLK